MNLGAKYLSIDHTFKPTTNISTISEGETIRQFKGLFFVVNEHSQIVTWALTKVLSLEELRPLLQKVLQRPQMQQLEFLSSDRF